MSGRYRSAAETMTASDDPESDLVPLTDSASLAELDELSRLDLAKHYLAAATTIYSDREHACHSLTVTAAPSAPATLQHTPTIEPPAVAQATGELLSEAWEAYKQDRLRRAPGWKVNVPEKAVLAFKDFIELIGDKQLRDVNRTDCTRFRDFQEVRPRGSINRYRGVNAASLEAMDIAREDRQSGQNAEHKISQIVSFFRWCVIEDHLTKSPAERLEIASDKGDPVQPWSPEEIKTLLSPTTLRTHSGMSDPRSDLAYFPWLAVLGAYTGARLGEIVNVRIEDFLVKDPSSQGDVPVMVVDAYEGKSIKTKNAQRKIPLHPDLRELGLWDYVAMRQRAGETMLLDCKEKSGSRAKEATQRFTKYTQRVGLHQARVKVFHSFRHAFKTQLEGHIAKSDVDLVLGHSRKDSAGGVYTHPLQIPMHRHHEAIKQLKFGLDLPALRDLLLSGDTGA